MASDLQQVEEITSRKKKRRLSFGYDSENEPAHKKIYSCDGVVNSLTTFDNRHFGGNSPAGLDGTPKHSPKPPKSMTAAAPLTPMEQISQTQNQEKGNLMNQERQLNPKKKRKLPISNSSNSTSQRSSKSHLPDPSKKSKAREQYAGPNSSEEIRLTDKKFPMTLKVHYKMLKSELESFDVAQLLKSEEILDFTFIEKLKNNSSRVERNDMLIKKLYKLANAGSSMTDFKNLEEVFVYCLRKTGQTKIAEDLQSADHQCLQLPNLSTEEKHKYFKFVKDYRDVLVKEVDPRSFLDDLIETDIITFDYHEQMCSPRSRVDRANRLLSVIDDKSDSTISSRLAQALEKMYSGLYVKYNRGKEGIPEVPVGETILISYSTTTNQNPVAQQSTEHNDPYMILRQFKSRLETDQDMSQTLEELSVKVMAVKFSSVKIFLKTLKPDSLQKVLEFAKTGKIIELLIHSLDDETKKCLLKKSHTVVVEVLGCDEEQRPSNAKENLCLCHLDKKIVELNSSILAKDMRGSRKTVSRLLELSSVSSLTKAKFKRIYSLPIVNSSQETEAKRNEILLDVLSTASPQQCFCILEEEIIKHGGQSIIQKIIEGTSLKNRKLTSDEVKLNKTVLMEELEPRWFLKALKQQTYTDYLIKEIETSECRQDRIRPFMEYLLKSEELSWFTDVLVQKNRALLADLARDRAVSSSEFQNDFKRVREATWFHLRDLVDEVDIAFIERYIGKETQEELQFPEVKALPIRSEQAASFCRRMLDAKESTFFEALNALCLSGYKYVVDKILTLAKNGPLLPWYHCPRITADKRFFKEQKTFFSKSFNLSEEIRKARSSYVSGPMTTSEVCDKQYESSYDTYSSLEIDVSYDLEYEPIPSGSGVKNAADTEATSTRTTQLSLTSSGDTKDCESGVFSDDSLVTTLYSYKTTSSKAKTEKT